MNFDNKNAIKRVTPCKFLCQIIFCNVEFAQNCRKFEFSGEKIEFHGKKSSFAIFGQNEFPSKRTKKACFYATHDFSALHALLLLAPAPGGY